MGARARRLPFAEQRTEGVSERRDGGMRAVLDVPFSVSPLSAAIVVVSALFARAAGDFALLSSAGIRHVLLQTVGARWLKFVR